MAGTGVQARSGQEPEEAATPALDYFLGDLEDEDALAMRDWQGEMWPW